MGLFNFNTFILRTPTGILKIVEIVSNLYKMALYL